MGILDVKSLRTSRERENREQILHLEGHKSLGTRMQTMRPNGISKISKPKFLDLVNTLCDTVKIKPCSYN